MSVTNLNRPLILKRVDSGVIPSLVEIEKISSINPWNEAKFKQEFNNELSHIFGAYESEKLIGFAVLRTFENEAEILQLAVAPAKRKKGVATFILSEIIRSLNSKTKIERINLEVRKRNKSAQALYKKLGFEIVGIRDNYYEDPSDDAILMTLV